MPVCKAVKFSCVTVVETDEDFCRLHSEPNEQDLPRFPRQDHAKLRHLISLSRQFRFRATQCEKFSMQLRDMCSIDKQLHEKLRRMLSCDLMYLFTKRFIYARSVGVGTPKSYGVVAHHDMRQTPGYVRQIFFDLNNDVVVNS